MHRPLRDGRGLSIASRGGYDGERNLAGAVECFKNARAVDEDIGEPGNGEFGLDQESRSRRSLFGLG